MIKKQILEEPKLEISLGGTKRWLLKNGDFHKENRPAIEYCNGYKVWYFNNECIFDLHNNDIVFYPVNTKPYNLFIFNNIYILNKETK